MTAPSVLLVPRELDFVASDLGDVYNLLRLWDDPPADDLAHARVLVCLGHQSPVALIARMPRLQLIACYTTVYYAVLVLALNLPLLPFSPSSASLPSPSPISLPSSLLFVFFFFFSFVF